MKNAPKDWVVCKIGDVCKTTQGIQIPISDQILRNDNGYKRYLYINDFKGETNFRYVEDRYQDKEVTDNDLVMANTGSPGAVFKGMEGILSNNLFKITFDTSKILRDYLFFFLSSQQFQSVLQQKMKGGIQKHLGHKTINEQNIVIPPIYIQNKIIEILERAENALEKRKESIKLLDELVKSRFIEMFGDPINNPKGWEKGTIADIIIKTQYGTSSKADEQNGEFKLLRMNNITYDGQWDFSSIKYVDLDEKEQDKYLVYKGEVLFNRTNSKELVGKTAVYKEDEPMAYAGYLVKAIPNERATGEFIAAYMNTKYVKSKLFNMAKNIVGMANINAEEFKKIDVYIPPIELQHEYIRFVEQVDKLKFAMESSLKELENNFNSLMQKAFNGELFN